MPGFSANSHSDADPLGDPVQLHWLVISISVKIESVE